jgi:Immune inhibitor A peptidase M6/PDZ domain
LKFMKRNLVLSLLILGFVLLLNAPLTAQDTSTQRDPAQLARQLLGWDGSPAIPEPTPIYTVGDKTQFWVSKAGQDTPVQITAILTAAAPELYIWAEDSIEYDPQKMAEVAARLEFAVALFSIDGNQGAIQTIPQTRAEVQSLDMLPMVDVDNDPHLFVLFATDLNTNRNSVYNPVNSAPAQWVAGGYTNQHEMIIINTSASPGLKLDDPAYMSIVAREFYKILTAHNYPGQAAWLREALSWYMLLQWQQQDIIAGDIQAFMDAPESSLTVPGGSSVTAGQLFLRYVRQRFGTRVLRELSVQSGEGLTALSRVLERNGFTDLVTGQPLAAEDVFADFVMTNLLNAPVGDGRFFYRDVQAAQGLSVTPAGLEDRFDFQIPDLQVSQYGANYVAFSATQPAQFTLFFDGAPSVPRLPVPGDPANHFYWSGNSLNQNASFTRAFDLTAVATATLQFDAWYILANHWNYGYVSVSADGGASWTVLPANTSTMLNPNALAYGPAFTGISNTEAPRPFPFLGIGLEANGITLNNIRDDSPFVGTDVKIGDTIAGHDGVVWEGPPNIVAYLASYEPGDTVSLHMQRGEEFFDVEVVLGAHPTRVFTPDPVWTAQTVDLSAYAGQPILLRFDYVSADDSADRGIAIDNIAIPEINYIDEAEAGVQGWTLNGWQQITNEVRQRFLVQYALLKPDNNSSSRIARLIGPRDRDTSGAWDFSLQAGEFLVVAVSGLNSDSDALATYTLGAQSRPSAAETTATPSS